MGTILEPQSPARSSTAVDADVASPAEKSSPSVLPTCYWERPHVNGSEAPEQLQTPGARASTAQTPKPTPQKKSIKRVLGFSGVPGSDRKLRSSPHTGNVAPLTEEPTELSRGSDFTPKQHKRVASPSLAVETELEGGSPQKRAKRDSMSQRAIVRHEAPAGEDGAIVAPLESLLPLTMRSTKSAKLNGIAMAYVPMNVLRTRRDDAGTTSDRPARVRFRPLDAWRGETVVYERAPGSETPSLCGLQLNCSPRPENTAPRNLQRICAMQVPLHVHGEVSCLSAGPLKSRVLSLPAWKTGMRPKTFVIPADSTGMLHVIDGSVRYTRNDDVLSEIVLHKGDSVSLAGGKNPRLLAVAGERGTAPPAILLCVLRKDDA